MKVKKVKGNKYEKKMIELHVQIVHTCTFSATTQWLASVLNINNLSIIL